MNIQPQINTLQGLAGNLSNAATVRDKVKLAERIFATLAECEKIVEDFIVGAMTANPARPVVSTPPPTKPTVDTSTARIHKGFRTLKLAEIARQLLTEHGSLHGKQIETMAKDGGFKSDSDNFQSYLSVALKREGGFENVGKNQWCLNPSIPPEARGPRASRSEPAVVAAPSEGPRWKQMQTWLQENGPGTTVEIIEGTGIPSGTVSSELSVKKNIFEHRDGKWHTR